MLRRRIARRIQYVLPDVEKPSFERRPRGVLYYHPSVTVSYGSSQNLIRTPKVVYPVLQGAIVNSTYGTHKNLPVYIYLFFLKFVGPIYYGPP